MLRFIIAAIACAILFPVLSFAQVNNDDSAFIRGNYTKREVYIPMRDGARLFTAIYEPKDNAPAPVLMERTPYSCSPYGSDNFPLRLGPNRFLLKEKYI